jgi:hypothetical protein
MMALTKGRVKRGRLFLLPVKIAFFATKHAEYGNRPSFLAGRGRKPGPLLACGGR